jgi:hypothetical protein
MSIGLDYISKLRPPTGLLFIPQAIYECGQPWRNDTERRNLLIRPPELSIILLAQSSSNKTGGNGEGYGKFGLNEVTLFILPRDL